MTPPPRALRSVPPPSGLGDLAEMSDAELIAVNQQFRTAMAAVDTRLFAALAAADSPAAVQREALAALAASPDRMLPMSALAATLGLSPTVKLTGLVDRLHAQGLAYRRRSTLDRRVVFVVLTDRGVTEEQRSTAEHAATLRAEFAVLGVERLRQLHELCLALPTSLVGETPLTPAAPAPPAPAATLTAGPPAASHSAGIAADVPASQPGTERQV